MGPRYIRSVERLYTKQSRRCTLGSLRHETFRAVGAIWNGSINPILRDREMQKVGADYAYLDDTHGNPVIASTDGRFGTSWPEGKVGSMCIAVIRTNTSAS